MAPRSKAALHPAWVRRQLNMFLTHPAASRNFAIRTADCLSIADNRFPRFGPLQCNFVRLRNPLTDCESGRIVRSWNSAIGTHNNAYIVDFIDFDKERRQPAFYSAIHFVCTRWEEIAIDRF